jgi:hypothetical protein
MATWNAILDELFDVNAHADRSRHDRLALWARLFGIVYEEELAKRDSPWLALSGATYRYVRRPATIRLKGAERAITSDFVLERDGQYFVVEAKMQPSANPRTIVGELDAVVGWAIGDGSTARTLRHLLLGLARGIPPAEHDEIARACAAADAPARRANAFIETVRTPRNNSDVIYEVQDGPDIRRVVAGVCLALPKPSKDALRQFSEIGVADLFSIYDLLADREPASDKARWLRDFAA